MQPNTPKLKKKESIISEEKNDTVLDWKLVSSKLIRKCKTITKESLNSNKFQNLLRRHVWKRLMKRNSFKLRLYIIKSHSLE